MGQFSVEKPVAPGSALSGNQHAIEMDSGFENKYVYYYCLSEEFTKQFRRSITGIIGGVSLNKFREINIPVPPLKYQRRIVAILDEVFAGLDAMRANGERNIANCEALLKNSLRDSFTVELANCEKKTLADVAKEFGRGKSRHRPRGDPKLLGGKYAFIQTGDVANATHEIETFSQTYNELGLAQSKLWPKGTVCIAIVGANVAETAILGFDACFPDSVIGLVPDPLRADGDFIQFLLTAHKDMLKEKGKGTARDNINMATFQEERFPLPNVQRQRQIAARLMALAEEINNLKDVIANKVAVIDELRKSLLHQAFSGNL